VHTGEIEMQGSEVGGLALHVAMRIATEARPGEILTSATVRDLVAGSDLRFGETHAKAIDGIADPLRMQTVEAGAPPTPVPARPAPRISAEAKRLSPREREILQFVARGLTNPEIAAALELSEHTVKRHVANILTKLHLSTRSAAATFAAQHGLA
jgi:DNA-binding NarL/FixJ family response regulator